MTVTKSKYALKKNDLYETEPWASGVCCKVLSRLGLWRGGRIWEPAAGNHKMVGVLMKHGASEVFTSDICAYTQPHDALFDFLEEDITPPIDGDYDLFTNPPYGHNNMLAARFARLALRRTRGYVALLLTAKFDFGSTRTDLFRDNDRFAAKIALLDRVSWEGNDKTGTEDHAWYIWGLAGQSYDPKLFYERNPAKDK